MNTSGLLSRIFNKEYSLGELLNISSERQERSSSCSVQLSQTYHMIKSETLLEKFKSLLFNSPTITMYYIIFKFQVISDTGNAHTVIVQTSPDYDIVNWETNKVKIYCDCNDFKFRSSYYLKQRGNLFINDRVQINLGQAMTDKPKRSTSPCCKHCHAVLQFLIQNYPNLMKTI